MSIDDLQKAHEREIDTLVARLGGKGSESDWALVRALVHKAVHVCAERRAGEFCAVATLMAEMITHAHQLLHPGDRLAPSHGADVH